jgi:hypothetical protein
MKITDYVKLMFDDPKMPDDVADAILWGCTGFPSFFRGDPIRCLTKQLRHAKRSLKRGFNIDQIYIGDDTLNPNHIPFSERHP